MKVTCEHCGMEFEVDDAEFGRIVQCPTCKTAFSFDQYVLIRMVRNLRRELAAAKANAVPQKRVVVQKRVVSSPPQPTTTHIVVDTPKKDAHGCVCFLLGLVFNFIGIIVAFLIGGGGGACAAAIGWLISTVIWLLIILGGIGIGLAGM